MRYLAPRVSDTPRPKRRGTHTHTFAHAHSYTPQACRDEWSLQHYNELLMPRQWRRLPTCVFLRAANNMGSTLPGPSAFGLVGGLWVIVSRGRPKMMFKCHEAQKDGRGFPTDTPFSYRVTETH